MAVPLQVREVARECVAAFKLKAAGALVDRDRTRLVVSEPLAARGLEEQQLREGNLGLNTGIPKAQGVWMDLVVVVESRDVIRVVAIVRTAHPDAFSEIPLHRQVPFLDDGVSEFDIRGQIEVIRTGLGDIGRE